MFFLAMISWLFMVSFSVFSVFVYFEFSVSTNASDCL